MLENSDRPVNDMIKTIETINAGVLDVIDYQYRGLRDIDIMIRQPEFTSVCPMTGLPDFGSIIIKYRPNQKIVELKSLKYYLLQYRNVGIFYEHVVNHILENLAEAVKPKYMQVVGDFTARGGITTQVTAEYEERDE
ncbi:MAG: preQ(1) synthase [Desulfobacterales bacterium]|nr:preQ(1) synthase [Desulfobacterales bacterium]MDD4073161.1 preQ(1) synthase [Desulfobacterales bacterium]MDD4392524.1 preQ(1) synthase [Desulfobacterales bacterium]